MDNYQKGGLLLAFLVIIYLIIKNTKNMVNRVTSSMLTAKQYNEKTGRKVKDVLTTKSNNPGAIFFFGDEWQGLDKDNSVLQKICYFKDKSSGIRAQVKTLWSYYNKHQLQTVAGIINRYAPSAVHNNNTENYIKFVCDGIGVGRDTKLDFANDRELYAKFAWFQHVVEAGFAWCEYDEYLTFTKQMK